MDLLQDLFSFTEMHIHQIKVVLQESRAQLMSSLREGLTAYQQTMAMAQINELQRYKLRQFRLFEFLLSLSAIEGSTVAALPLYICNSPATQPSSTCSSVSFSDSSTLEGRPSKIYTPHSSPASMMNQYVMFRHLYRGSIYYRPEYLLKLLSNSLILKHRFRHRFLMPYRTYYNCYNNTTFIFIPLREYATLLPMLTVIDNLYMSQHHLFLNIFCFFIKELLDLLAILHEHSIVLNGDLSQLCVNRLTGRLKLNLCTYSTMIPLTLNDGVAEDLKAVVSVIKYYIADTTLCSEPQIRLQLLQLAKSMQQTVSQEYDDSVLIIPDTMFAAKCLSQHPVFFSNAYLPVSIIDIDLAEVFKKAQQQFAIIKPISIETVPRSTTIILEGLGDTDASPSFEDLHNSARQSLVISQRPHSPPSRFLFETTPSLKPILNSHAQALDSSVLNTFTDSLSESSLSVESFAIKPPADTRVNLELKVNTPPPPLPKATRINDRYVYSFKRAENLRKKAVDKPITNANTICCACTHDQCLLPNKFPIVLGPRLPASAESVLQDLLSRPDSHRASSQPSTSNTVTTLMFKAPYGSPATITNVRKNVHSARRWTTALGSNILTNRTSSCPVKQYAQLEALSVQDAQTSGNTAPTKTAYVLQMDNNSMVHKRTQFPPLKQPMGASLDPKIYSRASSVPRITTVAPPAFPPSHPVESHRFSYSVAHQFSQDEAISNIIEGLGSQLPHIPQRRCPLPINAQARPRPLSAQPSVTATSHGENLDILYSRVTLHAPRLIRPEPRVFIERTLPAMGSTIKFTVESNPIEELNKALVNFC